MSQSIILTARERETIRILRVLNRETGEFVLVGGYAVNALAIHRFSVDCDLVTSRETRPSIAGILKREGYAKDPNRPEEARWKVESYVKPLGRGSVGVDLYIDGSTCRQTEGAWSYKFIRKNSADAIVAGVTGSASSRVAGRELLTALKLHSGRDQDLADIVLLSERANWKSVAAFAACGSLKKVQSQLSSELARLGRTKFVSDLRSQFGLRADVTPLIKSASEGLRTVRDLLPNQSFQEMLATPPKRLGKPLNPSPSTMKGI